MRTFSLSLSLILLSFACRSTDKEPLDTGSAPIDTAVDADGDGYDTTEDCDDNNSIVSPGAEEICDGVDNDCDGETDEGVTTTYYADGDGDGFGDPEVVAESCEPPEGYAATGTDCDDSDEEVFPSSSEQCDGLDNDCDGIIDEDVRYDWYADADGDGFGDPDSAFSTCDPPPGYVTDDTDCDDTESAAYPGGTEVCDEADNDCDGTVDEDVTTTYYQDTDADAYGVADVTTEACTAPTGYAAEPGDCDDTDRAVSPSATEVCDLIDNDCDGTIDEDDAADAETFYADADSDGYGDPATTTEACAAPSGYTDDASDCDDTDGAIRPDAAEVCDGVDNDCDGWTDDDDPALTGASSWYRDQDSDGYGDAATSTTACDQPTGYTSDATDCDDADSSSYPGGAESCDEADNDCDGTIDEGVTTTYYADTDSDGHGDAASTTEACAAPSGYVAGDADCDDADAAVSPNAPEQCDGVDNDCDGTTDEGAIDEDTFYADADADGYGDADDSVEACSAPSGTVADDTDCDDDNDDVSPDAAEVCDSIDNDCDGTVDEDDAADAETFYADADGDGYGDSSDSVEACSAPSGTVADDTDCDDDEAAANPGEAEACDEIDNDCDGTIDEGVTTAYYTDADADGYGDADDSVEACSAPSGTVGNDEDCDDTDGAISPDAAEVCDEVDNDCSGTADDDDELLGSAEDCPAEDCLDIYETRSTATDDTYWIDPASSGTAFETFCDLSNDGGGWTLVANIDDVSDAYFGGQQTSPWESTTLRNETSIPTFDVDVSVSTKYESWNTITVSDVRIVYKNSGAVFLCEDLSVKDTLDAIFSDTPTQGDCSSVCSTWSEDLLSETSIDDAGLNCSDPNEGWITSTVAENARIGALSYSHSCCVYNAFLGGMGDRGYSTSIREKTWGAYSSGTVTDDNIMLFVR